MALNGTSVLPWGPSVLGPRSKHPSPAPSQGLALSLGLQRSSGTTSGPTTWPGVLKATPHLQGLSHRWGRREDAWPWSFDPLLFACTWVALLLGRGLAVGSADKGTRSPLQRREGCPVTEDVCDQPVSRCSGPSSIPTAGCGAICKQMMGTVLERGHLPLLLSLTQVR